MPKFGRQLGSLELPDWESTVEKGAVLFGRENRDLGRLRKLVFTRVLIGAFIDHIKCYVRPFIGNFWSALCLRLPILAIN